MRETLDRDELRKLFLFESLSDEQLDWLTEHGEVRTVPAGETVVAEGDPPTCFFVLLSGTLALSWCKSCTPFVVRPAPREP